MNNAQKVEKILERVKLERGHIGIVGNIEFNYGDSKLENVSIFEDGTMRYTNNGRIMNRCESSYLKLKNPEILDNILEKINNNKFL